MSPIFDLLSPNSKAPSSTIKTSPIVAMIGNKLEKPDSSNPKINVSCFMLQPKSNNKITEGVLVFEAVKLKI